MTNPIRIKVIEELDITIDGNSITINRKVKAVDQNHESIELDENPKLLDASYIRDFLTAQRTPLKEYVLKLIEEKSK